MADWALRRFTWLEVSHAAFIVLLDQQLPVEMELYSKKKLKRSARDFYVFPVGTLKSPARVFFMCLFFFNVYF
jgi:hypothetical protein